MPAFVDVDTCTGCEECVDTCPTEAIEMVDDHAQVDPDLCTDCNACVDACPVDAISMVD